MFNSAIAETNTAIARDILRNALARADAIAQLLINSVRAQLGSTCLDLHRTLASDNAWAWALHDFDQTICLLRPQLLGTPFPESRLKLRA